MVGQGEMPHYISYFNGYIRLWHTKVMDGLGFLSVLVIAIGLRILLTHLF